MTTERIDVLAVLDRAIARNIERGAAKGSPSDRDLREARSAVAELIEAAKSHGLFLEAYFKACETAQPKDWMDAALLAKQWQCRTIEALARVGAP